MSDDVIRRSDAIKATWQEPTYTDPLNVLTEVRDRIEAIPSADRPQGAWIDRGDYAECSNCGAHSGTQYDGVEPIPLKTKFCPDCGAKMKGADGSI